MTSPGKHIVLFVVAAVCGGGVAFVAGRGENPPHLLPADTSDDKSKTVLRNEGGSTEGTRPSVSTPPSEEPASSRSKVLGALPPAQAVSTHDAAPLAQRQDETALKLLRSLRSSSSAVSGSSESEEKARQSLQSALNELLKHLRKSELSRSLIARRDTEGVISTFVKITPPTAPEIRTLREMLASLNANLPPQQLVQFQNQSMLLLRQFLFDPEKVLVVFITQQFAHSPSTTGNFHSHLTTRPDEYRHHHNGEQIGVPQGESTFEGGPLSAPMSPDFRYYHLAIP